MKIKTQQLKKIWFGVALVVLTTTQMAAQYSFFMNKEKVNEMRRKTLVIVLDIPQEDQNKLLDYVKTVWTFNEDIVFESKIDYKNSDNVNNLYLAFNHINIIRFLNGRQMKNNPESGDTIDQFYSMDLFALKFDKGKNELVKPAISFMNVNFYEEEPSAYKFMNALIYLQEPVLYKSEGYTRKNVRKLKDKEILKLKNKTLVVNREYLSKKLEYSLADLLKEYPYKFELKSRSDIKDIVERKDSSYAILDIFLPDKQASRKLALITVPGQTYSLFNDYYEPVSKPSTSVNSGISRNVFKERLTVNKFKKIIKKLK